MHTDFSQLLTDASIDAIIALDMDDTVVVWNEAAERMYGKKKVDVLGMHVKEAMPSLQEDDEFLKALDKAKEGFKSFFPASRILFHRLCAEIHIIPLVVDSQIHGIMFIVHGVSHRIRTEEKLVALNEELIEKVRQLELTTKELVYFTNIATHNIKEPLRLIYTSIEGIITSEGAMMSHSSRASFRRIQTTLTRISLLLDDLVTLSHISIVGRPDTLIDVEEIIIQVKESLSHKTRNKPVAIKMGELCWIRAHKTHVFQLFYHILSNLIKHGKAESPVIHITCQEVTLTEPDITIPPGVYQRLLIEYNGNGLEDIDTTQLSDILANISQKKYIGSIIALAIAYKVMQSHNGFITVQHGPDHSSLKFYFPT